MEGELEQFQNQNTQLDLTIADLKMKLKTSETETHRQIQKVGTNVVVSDQEVGVGDSSRYMRHGHIV